MVAGASLLFFQKNRGQELPLDEIKAELSGLRATISPRSTIGCMSFAQQPETEGWVANALVPVAVIPHRVDTDTTMFVFGADASDSVRQSRLAGRPVIWAEASEHYHFILAGKSQQ